MDWPKVSVVISTYKRPEMLREAVQSVIDQTFTDWELIVVDDAGGGVEEVLKSMDGEGHAIGVAVLPDNSGYQCKPKNVGILQSRGSYIAYLDDDNLWDVDHLQILVDEIEKMGCDAVYGRWRYRGKGPVTDCDSPYVEMTPPAQAGLCTSPNYNFIDTSAILHSKAAFVGAMGAEVWNQEMRRFGDWGMVADSIGLGMRWRGVDKVTFTYRWHGENLQMTRPANEVKQAATPAGANNQGWDGAYL